MTMLQVLSGDLTVSGAARRLSLSRNHFQTLMHRGLKGLIEGMSPHPSGRPPKPSRERKLELLNERLLKENRKLQSRVEMTDRLLKAASALLKGRFQPTGRSRPRRTSSSQKDQKDTDEEGTHERLDLVRQMIRLGLRASLAASVAGISVSTLRRWSRREAQGLRLSLNRGPQPHPPLDVAKKAEVESLVRQLHGLPGAAALSHSVPGVSRRQAAAIKHETLTKIERERVSACQHLRPTAPGLIRSFDQLHIPTTAGPWYALISADTAVPYRTSALLTPQYDGLSVAKAIQHDFALFGAPLVWRADRAKAHDTGEVREVLDHYKVLLLHGPPRLPRYYGSLERQNRDHRAWLSPLGRLDPDTLASQFGSMLDAFNQLWLRRSLGWTSPADAWSSRPPINIDRDAFRQQVTDRVARFNRHLHARGSHADMATRLAIEQTLLNHGLLGRSLDRRC